MWFLHLGVLQQILLPKALKETQKNSGRNDQRAQDLWRYSTPIGYCSSVVLETKISIFQLQSTSHKSVMSKNTTMLEMTWPKSLNRLLTSVMLHALETMTVNILRIWQTPNYAGSSTRKLVENMKTTHILSVDQKLAENQVSMIERPHCFTFK